MIKQLTQRARRPSATCLLSIDGIESLIAQQRKSHETVAPERQFLRVACVIVEVEGHCGEIEAKTDESDHVGSNGL